MRRLLRILGRVTVGLVVLLILAFGFIQTGPGKRMLAGG